MKKAGVILIVLLVCLVIVSAQSNESMDERAYECLKNKVKDKCSSLTLEEQVFSLLALADNSAIQTECKNEIKDKGDECFPSGSCNIKSTALALLALNFVGEDTEDIEDWLLEHKKLADLEWYLEIDLEGEGQCEIEINGKSTTVNVGEDKKLSGRLGNCLSYAYSNYWLKINEDCLNKNISVSCDKDFISTLLYKKEGSNIWHVSSEIESASAGGKTEHIARAYCFSSSQSCDYEGSLWAALALTKAGRDIDNFIPYLITASEDNKKYFPESFLYYLTNSEEYLGKILTLQKLGGYWDLGEKGKYYDTALALFSLEGGEARSNALGWLEETQDAEGCWNNGNIRDTAIILWAVWPKQPIITTTSKQDNCEDFNYYCTSRGECEQAGGNILDNFYCSGLQVCCDTQPTTPTCSEKGGIICSEDEECDESTVSAFDTDECCLGSCVPKLSECEQAGYVCRASCLDNEELEGLYECGAGYVCCKEKIKEEGGHGWLYFLIILIVLVVLGIIFRDKLRLWIFKIRNKFKKGKGGQVTKTRPSPPAPPSLQRPAPRLIRPPVSRLPPPAVPKIPPKRRSSDKDKELEETLKKLKEMSK